MPKYELAIYDDVDCEEVEQILREALGVEVSVYEAPERKTVTEMPRSIARADMSKIIKNVHFTAGKTGRLHVAYLIFHNIRKHLQENS